MSDAETLTTRTLEAPVGRRPKLGFAGVGWIGRNRLEAVAQSGLAEIKAVYDPAIAVIDLGATRIRQKMDTFEALLASDVDGIVIATPNAFHATQAIAALQAGKAVFCQKPLTRTAGESREVLAAARTADRLLAVDFSYRFSAGMQRIRELITTGALGSVYAVEMKFHNAYGPDKNWFYNPSLAGGGCLLDLGIHLLDLAFWTLGETKTKRVTAQLLTKGTPWSTGASSVEDYAAAQLEFASGASLQLSCSWRAPAGCDADISITFFGSKGGASFRNVNGSFYDFVAEHFFPDRTRRVLAAPPDRWGDGAILDWVRQLTLSPQFNSEAEELVAVAEVIDQMYGRKQ